MSLLVAMCCVGCYVFCWLLCVVLVAMGSVGCYEFVGCYVLCWLLCVVLVAMLQVFGSFIASPLSDRHGKQFFGTGESFLFSVYPEAKCYQWTAKTDLILRATDHELIIGAGGGYVCLFGT